MRLEGWLQLQAANSPDAVVFQRGRRREPAVELLAGLLRGERRAQLRTEWRAETGRATRLDAELQLAVAERRLIKAAAVRRRAGAVLAEVLRLLLEIELRHAVLAGGVLIFDGEGVRRGRGQHESGGDPNNDVWQRKTHRSPAGSEANTASGTIP